MLPAMPYSKTRFSVLTPINTSKHQGLLLFTKECTQVEALEAASLHPAKVLNISSSKGSLDFNKDADFVLLDDKLQVLATFIAGKCVYEAPGKKPYEIIPVDKEGLAQQYHGVGDGYLPL